MKKLFLITGLLVSFLLVSCKAHAAKKVPTAPLCPFSSNLSDKSTRDRCLHNYLREYEAYFEKQLIQRYHYHMRAGHTLEFTFSDNGRLISSHLQRIHDFQKLMDKLEDDGHYQPLIACPACNCSASSPAGSSSSEDDSE